MVHIAGTAANVKMNDASFELNVVMSLVSWYDSIPFHFRILVSPL